MRKNQKTATKFKKKKIALDLSTELGGVRGCGGGAPTYAGGAGGAAPRVVGNEGVGGVTPPNRVGDRGEGD